MIADRLMDAVFDRNEHEIAGMIADTAIDRDFLQSLRGTEIANLAEEGRAAIFHGEQRSLCTAHLIERRDRLIGERPVGNFEQKVTRHAGLGGHRLSTRLNSSYSYATRLTTSD